MDRLEEIHERGRRARAVLENETIVEAMDHITDQLQRQWRATTSPMTEARERLFHQLSALDAVRAQLKSWVDAADFEKAQQDKREARRLRVIR